MTAAACLQALSLVLLITSTAAFVTHASRRISTSYETKTSHTKTSTSLAGTIRFVGKASASVSGDTILNDDDEGNEKSLYKFLSSDASNKVLLGTDNTKLISSAADGGDEIWECTQGSVGWFGLTLIPIFVQRIERGSTEGKVTTSIEEARTEVQGGSGLGNALSSAMKRSEFEGRTIVTWKEGGSTYHMGGDLELNLTIKLPRLLPLPPGFNAIGSKIVERTCGERLKQNLIDTKAAYIEWAETPTNQ